MAAVTTFALLVLACAGSAYASPTRYFTGKGYADFPATTQNLPHVNASYVMDGCVLPPFALGRHGDIVQDTAITFSFMVNGTTTAVASWTPGTTYEVKIMMNTSPPSRGMVLASDGELRDTAGALAGADYCPPYRQTLATGAAEHTIYWVAPATCTGPVSVTSNWAGGADMAYRRASTTVPCASSTSGASGLTGPVAAVFGVLFALALLF